MFDVTLSGIVIKDSNEITLTDTRKLIGSMFCYSYGIRPCTKILTVEADKVIISNNAYDDFTGNVVFTDLIPAMYQARCEALKSVQFEINNIGSMLAFHMRGEENITRDKYQSIKHRGQEVIEYIKCYPIDRTPTELTLEKAGLRESSDVILTTASKDWVDKGYTLQDVLDIKRCTVTFDGASWEVKEISHSSQFGNTYLNINFGLFKL